MPSFAALIAALIVALIGTLNAALIDPLIASRYTRFPSRYRHLIQRPPVTTRQFFRNHSGGILPSFLQPFLRPMPRLCQPLSRSFTQIHSWLWLGVKKSAGEVAFPFEICHNPAH